MKKQITKSYLQYLGVTEVTPDGRVFTKNGELKPQIIGHGDRLAIKFHDPEKYKATPKEKRNSGSGTVWILFYHAVYAWFNLEVPYGKEIHHKDGNYLNNAIDNLEALTHDEHRAKHASTRELKCRLDISREWYQKQLDELEAIENKTKVNYDSISNYRAKLRYYDSHIKEAEQMTNYKKDLEELKYWKQRFREAGNKAMWHQCCKVEKLAKESPIEQAQKIVAHALEVIHRTFN